MRKFKDVKFTDDDFVMINDLIDTLNLNGNEKFSDALDDLDRKYNISQREYHNRYNSYSLNRYDKLKKMKDIVCKVHLL